MDEETILKNYRFSSVLNKLFNLYKTNGNIIDLDNEALSLLFTIQTSEDLKDECIREFTVDGFHLHMVWVFVPLLLRKWKRIKDKKEWDCIVDDYRVYCDTFRTMDNIPKSALVCFDRVTLNLMEELKKNKLISSN